MFLLTHCSVYDSDTICNNLSSPLADIIHLCSVMYRHQPNSFKMRQRGKDFYVFIKNASFISPIEVGSHKNFFKIYNLRNVGFIYIYIYIYI